ncbi:MAG: sulfatase [Planctomycetota bacterium]
MTRKRPNIVVVVADDITPSYHGCYGGPTPTPNIDRIASDGVRMQRGYGCSSLCCPSRWNLFTGQFTGRSRWAHQDAAPEDPYCISQNGMLDLDTPTLAKTLRGAGYHTGHIGKWHSRFNVEGDFDFEEPVRIPGDPDDPAVDAEIRRRHANAVEVVKRTAGFEHVDCVNWGNLGSKQHDPRLRAHNIGWMTDGALDFLDQAGGDDRPFYLHLANTIPHAPDCLDSLGVDHRYTWAGKLDEAPRSHPADETVIERLRAAGIQTSGPIASVNAGMIMIDDQIGAILRKLDEIGERDNTIVIYTADHGVPGKGSCYATGQHLPFVMAWPAGMPGGQVVHDIFSWVDVVPTLCAACDVQMPAEHILDGVDVLPALQGRGSWPRQLAYHEMGWSRSVIKGRYHYIANRYPQTAIQAWQRGEQQPKPGIGVGFDSLNAPFLPDYFAPDQLYDLQTDPFERSNLVDDPTRAPVLADLKAELKTITDTLPRPFPAEPDPFLESDTYQKLLSERRAEMDAIQHYPAGDAPHIWFANLHDPDAD